MRPEFAQALDLLRTGAPDSIEKAIGVLQNTTFSLAVNLCGNREYAKYLTDKVLHHGLRRLTRVENSADLVVWLYTATRNACWPTRQKGAAEKQISVDEVMPNWPELDFLIKYYSPCVERSVLNSEEQQLLQEAVLSRANSPRDGTAWKNVSTEKVAQVLDCKPDSVRTRLNRGWLMVRKGFSRLIRSVANAERPVKKLVRANSARLVRPATRQRFNLGRVHPTRNASTMIVK